MPNEVSEEIVKNIKKEVLKEVDKKYMDCIFHCHRAIKALAHSLETIIFYAQKALKEKELKTTENYIESADEITLAIQGQCIIIDKKLSCFIQELCEEDDEEIAEV